MNCALCILLAALSVWDYPSRQLMHDRLRRQFIVSVREGDTETMEETCRKGVKLLPDDPTWHYNLACSLAYYPKRSKEAFDELEKAIDLGFRNVETIAADTDLKRLANHDRYGELIDYAKEMSTKPLLTGPLVHVDATGIFGKPIALGEQNYSWDFDSGCFVAHLRLAVASAGGNTGDLYVNRDNGHSSLRLEDFPGITAIRLDAAGKARGIGLNEPDTLYPYPVFGNCSRAYVGGPFWRSIPRSLMTRDAYRMQTAMRFYLSNQTWVIPANWDTPPVGTNGDVFASIAPYWMVTVGRSYSDQPYLRAALEASRSFKTETKREIVRRGLLAPTIQALIRQTLPSVKTDEDYLSAKAHPTALPGGGPDLRRLVDRAGKLEKTAIPPLAVIAVSTPQVKAKSPWPELTYATGFAWAYVLRSDDRVRTFNIEAKGAEEFRFVKTHGNGIDVKVETFKPNAAKVTIDRTGMSPTNRVDIAVFGRNAGTAWGAPSYVSFARMDSNARYSDPVLTILEQPKTK